MPPRYTGTPSVSAHSSLVPAPGRRLGAKPIDSRKFKGGLLRLHRYRLAMQLEGTPIPPSFDSSAPFMSSGEHQPTLSTASQTNPLDDNESSIGTSITEFTTIFSADNGVERPEPEKKGLAQVPKARKALLRYLGACEKGCRDRKVKCFLSHHALEDMLDGQHSVIDQENVKWALETDWDPRQTPMIQPIDADLESSVATLIPSLTDETVIERANRMLGLQSTPDALYPQRIEDPDDAFLGQDPFSLYQEVADFSYSTAQNPGTFALGLRINSLEGDLLIFRHYQCWWFGCDHTYRSHEDLQLHYSQDHVDFIRIQPDPLRLACPSCFKFYPGPEGFCTNQFCPSPSPMVLVEYICGESLDESGPSMYSLGDETINLPVGETSFRSSKSDLSTSWGSGRSSTFAPQDQSGSSYSNSFDTSTTSFWFQQLRDSEHIPSTSCFPFPERQSMTRSVDMAKSVLQSGGDSKVLRRLFYPFIDGETPFLHLHKTCRLLSGLFRLIECTIVLCRERCRFIVAYLLVGTFHQFISTNLRAVQSHGEWTRLSNISC